MRRTICFVALLVLSACAPSTTPDDSTDGTWVGTITTEGNVTTVDVSTTAVALRADANRLWAHG